MHKYKPHWNKTLYVCVCLFIQTACTAKICYIYAHTNICLLYACANRYFFHIFYLSLKLARKESLFPKRYPLKIRDKTNGRRTKRVQKKHARCRGEWNAEPDSD